MDKVGKNKENKGGETFPVSFEAFVGDFPSNSEQHHYLLSPKLLFLF